MKITDKQNTLERVGVVARKTCSMAINSHAFNLLARQYSDPIKAILQELGCNAVDSHKRSGNSMPFLVHLPTKTDPQFRIRDFGTGMDETKIDNVYVNWMESDKRQTNDETGYFGIGSKTPLAYGDSFNITTYTDGVMRTYTMCRNENDIPELQSYGSEETTEPNGVEISFAVKEDDFLAFQEKAKQVYQYFNLKPIVNGNPQFFDELPIYMSGTNWVFYEAKNTPVVVMGGVAYPVTYSVKDSIRYIDYDLYRFINNGEGLVIEVPIGSLDITPSREALEITPRTTQTMVEVLKAVRSEISQIGKQSLSLENVKDLSDWAYYLKLQRTVDEFNNLGIRVHTERDSGNYPRYHGNGDLRERGCYFIKHNGDVGYQNRSRTTIVPHKKSRFVMAQDMKGMDRRLRAYIEKSKEKISVHVIEGVSKVITQQDVMDYFGFNQDDDLFIDVTQLPVLPKAVRTTSGGTGSRKPRNMLRVEILGSCGWEETLIDPTSQDYYYVEMHREQVKLPSTTKKDYNFTYAPIGRITLYERLFGIKIVGVRSKDMTADLLKVPTMHNFCDEFLTLIKNYVQNNQSQFNAYLLPTQFSEYIRQRGAWEMHRLTERTDWLQEALGDEHILTQISKVRQVAVKEPEMWREWVAHCEITLDSLKDQQYCGRLVGDWMKDIDTACKIYAGIDGCTTNPNVIKAVDFYVSSGMMDSV